MTLVTVSSVKGAPGGTTVALLLTRSFAENAADGRTCLLAECDLSGGDLAPLFDLRGVPGMASLALAARHGLTRELLMTHTQAPAWLPEMRLLLGVAGPEQGMALSWILADLGRALMDPSLVAVADLGRLRPDDRRQDDLRQLAGANLLVTTDSVASLLHAKAAVQSARQAAQSLSVVVTGERSRRLSHIAAATSAEVLGAVRFDPPALSAALHPSRAAGRVHLSQLRKRSDGLSSDIDAIVSRLVGCLAAAGQPRVISPAWIKPPTSAHRGDLIGRLRRRAAFLG